MNKIEKVLFTILFVIGALFVLVASLCWIKYSILISILFSIIFIPWGAYAFLNAWFELDNLCSKRHKKE